MYHNLMVDFVKTHFDEAAAESGIKFCRCNDCVEDIIALALNNLPPCYSTTIRGKVFLTSTYKQPEKVDMIHRAIIDAIAIVSRNPRHNEERICRPML